MDFANERYVRLYVRETTEQKLLRWEAQALWPHILRLVDRSGVFDLGGIEPAEAISLHLPKWPIEFIRAGIENLTARKVIEIGDETLFWPRYQDAQEAKHTDRLRAAEARARRRELAGRKITPRDSAVTLRDATVTGCDDRVHTTQHNAKQAHATQARARRESPETAEPDPTAGPQGQLPTGTAPPDPGEDRDASSPTEQVRLPEPLRGALRWFDEEFREAYPEYRRHGELERAIAWIQENPPDAESRTQIMARLERWRNSPDWAREEGRYIPNIGKFFYGGYTDRDPPKPTATGGATGRCYRSPSGKVFDLDGRRVVWVEKAPRGFIDGFEGTDGKIHVLAGGTWEIASKEARRA